MNDLATTNGTQIATRENTASNSGALNSDILIPKLLLMQGLSDFVAERKAQMGDMVRSTTVEKLGDIETPIEIIPLKIANSWREEEKVGQKFEFRKGYSRTVANEQLPWTFYRNPQGQDFDKPGQLGATEWRRSKVIDCFALLPKDIQAFQTEMAAIAESGEIPDLNKTVLPVVISFRVTSFNAGRSVATFFSQVDEMRTFKPGLEGYNFTLPLSARGEKNDKGNFFVFEVGKSKPLAKEMLPTAKRWFDTLNAHTTRVKVDETGDGERAGMPDFNEGRF